MTTKQIHDSAALARVTREVLDRSDPIKSKEDARRIFEEVLRAVESSEAPERTLPARAAGRSSSAAT